MPTLLLKLKNVPDDEHLEVCELLDSNNIEYYETGVGFWGIGMAAIWLRDPSQLDIAHRLLNDYMRSRQQSAQKVHKEAVESGEVRTLLTTFKQQPVTFILYCLAMVIIAGLTIIPFIGMM